MRTLSEKEQFLQTSPATDAVSEQKWPRTFAALRHRNYRLVWCSQSISLIGTWMQSIGQSWLVLQMTNDALLLGLVGALQFLPVMLLALFGGVLADRLPKRKVLLFTQSFAMLQAATLWILVATGTVQLWHLFILAILLGTTHALDMPARQAFIVELVGRKDLPNAIALNSSVFNMARIVGPGLGGLIIAWLGEAPLFLLNAISFIPLIIALSLIDMKLLHASSKQVDAPKQSTLQSLREGLTYVVRTPSILLIVSVVGIVSLFGINFNVTLPLFATDVLHTGPEGFGFISAAYGVGSLLSALWLAWRSNKPSIAYVLLAAIFFGILEIGFALSQWYLLSLVLIASVGFAQIAFSATANTTLQTVAPDHLRGRVMSVYMVVFAGSVPFGNLFTGFLAQHLNAPIALLIGAGISFAVAIAGWVLRAPAEKSMVEAGTNR